MQHVLRCATVLVAALAWPLRAAPSADTSEYKQADTSFYLKSDVLQADPSAIILLPDAVTDIGGSYLVPMRNRAVRVVYLEQMHDWIEPITPPSMPASLNIPGNAMQVREPQGNVRVALPTAPADFHSIKEGMTLPNGSVLKTGDNGSVAVLFGGVDSVRLAPDSEAAVQMTVADGRRDAEVDIHGGMVFSKVGQRVGEKENYEVHTPFGIATAHGTDFVTAVLPQRVDVWVAEGTVELTSAVDQRQIVRVADNGPFQVMHSPAAPDAATALAESAETLTTILNFIPMANQKLKRLSERTHAGAKLTPTERAYMGRIRKIPALIKLASLAPDGTPEEPVVPLTPPGPSRRLPTPLEPIIAPRPAPAAKPKSPAHQAVTRAAVTKANEAAKPHHKKPVVTKTVEKTASKPVIAKKDENEEMKPAISRVTEVAKPKPTAKVPEDAKLKPPAEPFYPRAKPVSAAELTETVPTRKPAPTKSHAEVDPNSLGAPLNPYAAPIAPASAGTSVPVKKSGSAANGSGDTVP